MRAAEKGDEKRVRELVAAGAKLNLVTSGSWCALHIASCYGRLRIAKLLLDGKYEGKGADINLRAKQGSTPLIEASLQGHVAVVRLLLERGADATLQSERGSALSRAANGRTKALLHAHGATA
jgi:ankyrin repeat protein